MDESIVANCVRQSEILTSYITVLPVFSMIPKAVPFFIIQGKADKLKNANLRFSKVMMDSTWFVERIGNMTTSRDLVEVVNNFIPMGKDTSLDERCKSTICRTFVSSFEKFGWSTFGESTDWRFVVYVAIPFFIRFELFPLYPTLPRTISGWSWTTNLRI